MTDNHGIYLTQLDLLMAVLWTAEREAFTVADHFKLRLSKADFDRELLFTFDEQDLPDSILVAKSFFTDGSPIRGNLKKCGLGRGKVPAFYRITESITLEWQGRDPAQGPSRIWFGWPNQIINNELDPTVVTDYDGLPYYLGADFVALQWLDENNKGKREVGPYSVSLRGVRCGMGGEALRHQGVDLLFTRLGDRMVNAAMVMELLSNLPEMRIQLLGNSFFESPLDEMVFLEEIVRMLEGPASP